MFIEYAAVLDGGIQEVWVGKLRPLVDTVVDSPYFWAGVALASWALFRFTRSLLK